MRILAYFNLSTQTDCPLFNRLIVLTYRPCTFGVSLVFDQSSLEPVGVRQPQTSVPLRHTDATSSQSCTLTQ